MSIVVSTAASWLTARSPTPYSLPPSHFRSAYPDEFQGLRGHRPGTGDVYVNRVSTAASWSQPVPTPPPPHQPTTPQKTHTTKSDTASWSQPDPLHLTLYLLHTNPPTSSRPRSPTPYSLPPSHFRSAYPDEFQASMRGHRPQDTGDVYVNSSEYCGLLAHSQIPYTLLFTPTQPTHTTNKPTPQKNPPHQPHTTTPTPTHPPTNKHNPHKKPPTPPHTTKPPHTNPTPPPPHQPTNTTQTNPHHTKNPPTPNPTPPPPSHFRSAYPDELQASMRGYRLAGHWRCLCQ
ncbi:hypothetical protein J6590_057268 [Homalodisca vitripennis]|nr:hypothetical protein J6590_057268 [Homalodisca vitripennis]